jgi:hypothetical protein
MVGDKKHTTKSKDVQSNVRAGMGKRRLWELGYSGCLLGYEHHSLVKCLGQSSQKGILTCPEMCMFALERHGPITGVFYGCHYLALLIRNLRLGVFFISH